MTVDIAELEVIGRALLVAIGEDPDRDGLRDTPKRWARWWQEFLEVEKRDTWTSFDALRTDQMVVVRNIAAWSLCEHHLLPFSCDVSVGYLATGKLLGLSKLVRIVRSCTQSLQMQERLVEEIAAAVHAATGSESVAVVVRGKHLCMAMRGVRDGKADMVTSVMRGTFLQDSAAREEFLALAY